MDDIWQRVIDRLETPTVDYQLHPDVWMNDKLDEFAWSVQRKIQQSVVQNRSTACPSCHGVGKSFIASRIAAWWIDSHPPGEAFVVTTAPTAAQVSAILWRYIGQAHKKGELIGHINRSPYNQWLIGTDLVGYGRKPADYEQSAFQGIHAKYVLVIVDEADGIARGLWDAVDSLATNKYARVLAIGNPNDPSSFFAEVCKPDSDWNVIQIDALRTPNMTDELTRQYPLTRALMQAEGIPFSTEEVPDYLRDELVDALWVEERIRRWAGFPKDAHLNYAPDELADRVRKRCAGSGLFLAKVRGVFPTNASTGVVPLGWAQQAMNRWDDWVAAGRPETPGRRVVGVDVAREGEDDTCLAPRQGDVVREIERHSKQDTMATVRDVWSHLTLSQSMAVIDVIGIGAGVVDRLRELRREGKIEAEIVDFNASANSGRRDLSGEFKFRNDRAAAWWRMRELLDPSRGSKLAIPNDERLLAELTATRWRVLNGGIIAVEEKADIRRRLGRSTDAADAVIQSCWIDGLTPNYDLGAYRWNNDKRDSAVIPYEHSGTWGDDFDSELVGSGWDTG